MEFKYALPSKFGPPALGMVMLALKAFQGFLDLFLGTATRRVISGTQNPLSF